MPPENRGLDYITSNQCGNVVLVADNNNIDIWVQNIDFAIARGFRNGYRNEQGYAFCGTIKAD